VRDVVYRQYAEAFETHWWSEHRRIVVSRELEKRGFIADGKHRVLEIGCGAGTEHRYLSRFGPVTGVEINPAGLKFCQERGYATLIEGDLNLLDLPKSSCDLAIDFHVLYHEWVKDPRAVLERIHGALEPGGYFVMTEPAFEWLRRGHDEAVMAARRWKRQELAQLLESAGFEVLYTTGFLTLLLPAVMLSLLLDKVRSTAHEVDEIRKPSALADSVLRAVMAVERAMLRVLPLPLGTSWLLLARRR
jgi:SAM-dependent methyltransferase